MLDVMIGFILQDACRMQEQRTLKGGMKHAERNWRTHRLRKPRPYRALLLGMTRCLCTKITRFDPGLRGM
jgi:hypothetical protein